MGSWNLAHVDPRAPGYGQMTTKWWLQTKMAAFLYLLGHVFLNTRDAPAQFHSSQGNQVSWGATFWSGVQTVECFLVTHQNVWFRKILAAVWQISRMSVFEGCWDRTKSSLTWSPQTKMADCLCDLGACFLLETFFVRDVPSQFYVATWKLALWADFSENSTDDDDADFGRFSAALPFSSKKSEKPGQILQVRVSLKDRQT